MYVSAMQRPRTHPKSYLFRPRRWLVRENIAVAVVPCAVGLETHGRVGPSMSLEPRVRFEPARASTEGREAEVWPPDVDD
jgi:hypothetical protein